MAEADALAEAVAAAEKADEEKDKQMPSPPTPLKRPASKLAKAKGSPKASPKSQAKASAKAALKRPASVKQGILKKGPTKKKKKETGGAEKTEKPDKKEGKKSAAAQRDLERAKALQWESPDGPVSGELQQGSAEAAAETRDKKKSWFFQKNYQALPKAARDLFESKEVSRADKTKLVNSAVEIRDGKMVLAASFPVLDALSTHYKSVVGQECLGCLLSGANF